MQTSDSTKNVARSSLSLLETNNHVNQTKHVRVLCIKNDFQTSKK